MASIGSTKDSPVIISVKNNKKFTTSQETLFNRKKSFTTALEKVLAKCAGKYSFGDEITMADCCLVPQVANAHRFLKHFKYYILNFLKELQNEICVDFFRFQVPITEFKTIVRVDKELAKVDAFKKAHALNQIDCPPEMKSKY